jgi:hypothetical protein
MRVGPNTPYRVRVTPTQQLPTATSAELSIPLILGAAMVLAGDLLIAAARRRSVQMP